VPNQWVALVVGLINGKNVPIVARAGGETAQLVLINHAVNRELFSGPLQTPFVCELDALGLKPTNTTHLGPLNADCTAPSTYNYFYKTKGGEWKPYDVTKKPGDVATVKIDGKDVNLIVRQERGVTNRSGYVINILHDPSAGPVPDFKSKGGSAWNGKLVYSFGPGAKAGYHQGRNFGGLNAGTQYIEETAVGAMDAWIARGYAVASGSLNSFGTSTDDVVSAETAYKVKEQFIKAGVPVTPSARAFRRPMAAAGRECLSGHSRRRHPAPAVRRRDDVLPAAVRLRAARERLQAGHLDARSDECGLRHVLGLLRIERRALSGPAGG
jgi:hypothetical protein